MSIGVSAPSAGGIQEGVYTSWSFLWEGAIDDRVYDKEKIGIHIDDINDKLFLSWQDKQSPPKHRFSIKDITDYTNIFLSPQGTYYMPLYTINMYDLGLIRGYAYLGGGGLSVSLNSYALLLRGDEETIEVWQGGASALWSRDTTIDGIYTGNCYGGIISITGKYIVLLGYSNATDKLALFCYEGS